MYHNTGVQKGEMREEGVREKITAGTGRGEGGRREGNWIKGGGN